MADNNNNNKNVVVDNYEVQDTFTFAHSVQPLHAPNCSEYAVAHSNVCLQPARQMSEIEFLPHINYAMRRLRLTQLLRVQSYAWPYLKKGSDHGVVIVGAPRSGRTLSYVPPLCQVVCTTLTEHRSRRRWELNGPIAIILASDLGRVQQIGGMCNTMLRKAKNEEWLSLVLTVPSAHNPDFFLSWLNGVGCLVATPAQFLWLRSYDILKMPDLRFIVYDDVDLMPADQLIQAHQQLLGLTKYQRPQLAIVSQSYNHKLLHMLFEFNAHPMVLFGDILEGALYGGARIRMSLLKSEEKPAKLLQLLEKRSPLLLRTVINCQSDAEISNLEQILENNGYRCLAYYQTADMEVRDHVHRWMQNHRGMLLLCTDACPELNIRHAQTLIHYSPSDSWSKFKLRHLQLADNLKNQFEQLLSKEEEQEKESKKQFTEKLFQHDGLLSLVFLDETNNKQLPRLVDFLKMHQHVEESLVLLASRIRDQLESLKCNEPALCDLLLSLGHCGDTLCNQRHQLLSYDRLLPPGLPGSGNVKVQLVRVYSPTHYCVRLLEHLPPGGNWQPVPRETSLEMKLQLLQSKECLRHWPPKAKDICTFRNDYGYERVRILHVEPIKLMHLPRTDLAVEVQAMDVDTRQIKTTSGKLFICPEELLSAPPLAIDLRILGMVPFTGERTWHENDGLQCVDWLNSIPKPNFLQASIAVSLSHTIFVDNVAVTSYAPSLQMHVQRFNMCQQLTKTKLAKKYDQAIAKLMLFLADDKDEAVNINGKETEGQQSVEQQVIQQNGHQEPPKEQKQTENKVLSGRSGYFAQMALQLGKANSRRLEEEQQQQKQLAQNDNTDNSVEALFKCLMNCSLLDLQEKQQSSDINCNVPEELLKQVIEPLKEQPKPTPVEQPKMETNKTATEVVEKVNNIHYQTPSNVVRPEVIYYQTRCTLELQVILPEDNMQYEAWLQNATCIGFWTLGAPESIKYQFIVNTHCSYDSFQHHMQGRTVYISFLKTLCVSYPLDFSFYKFMKPQHEMLNRYEENRKERVLKLETYLLSRGYIKGSAIKHSNDISDISSDEEPIFEIGAEHVERATDITEFICD